MTFRVCVGIAKDLDDQCEYISLTQDENPHFYPFAPGGPSLKIGVEFGWLGVSEIWSKHLGTQQLFIGPAVNYASRITQAGVGNRCLLGPDAVKNGLGDYQLDGPFTVAGKPGEPDYVYYELPLGDIWREGDTEETYWG